MSTTLMGIREQYAIVSEQISIQETKEYHLKRLYELSLKSLGEIPQLEEPTYEQKQWFVFRMTHPSTWPKVHENKIGDYRNWTQ